MKNLIIKLLLTLIGLSSLIFCIVDEVDGIGRFALILFGVIFIFFGSFKKVS